MKSPKSNKTYIGVLLLNGLCKMDVLLTGVALFDGLGDNTLFGPKFILCLYPAKKQEIF